MPSRIDVDLTAQCGYFSRIQFHESMPLGFEKVSNRIAKGILFATAMYVLRDG